MTTLASILAHAFGKRYDLPVPLVLFLLGGGAVVFVSFLVVLPTPVASVGDAAGEIGDTPRLRAVSAVGSGLMALVTLLLCAAGWLGSQEVAENILPTAFWLVVWVAVPISCGVVGDWTAGINPFAALARLVDREPWRRALLGGGTVGWPGWLAWWPAVVLLFVVACGELVFNAIATLPAVTAWGLLIYALLTAGAALLFGADAWLARGELFSVLFATWGRLGWFRFGAPGPRGFGGGLRAPFDATVSRITFVLLLLVSVAFDGLLSTDAWKTVRLHLPLGITPGTAAYLTLSVVAFALLACIAWALFGLFAAAVRRAGRLSGSVLELLAGLLPSLLPIAFGYLAAHNAEYLAINGQLLLPLAGNPAGLGWHLLPYPFTDAYEVNSNLIPSAIVWYGQVVLIVAVHVAAVVLAHRYLARAARTVSLARRSEWPWIVAMVSYTMTSLWLLAQPLVEQGGATALLVVHQAAGPGAMHAVLAHGIHTVCLVPAACM